MTPEELQTPPTEIEISELSLLLSKLGCPDNISSVVRRLAFERDKLKRENKRHCETIKAMFRNASENTRTQKMDHQQ